jgi:2-keto-4-pentenoate hydratase
MNRTEKTARKLFDNWYSKGPYETLSGEFAVGSVADAYDVQLFLQNLHKPNRGKVAGRKIALSSKTMQQMVGLDDPIAGGIFSGDVALSPATIKACEFVRLGLEFELAIELNSDVLPQTQVHTRQSACDYVAAVRPAFELIEDRNADYANLDPFTLIADNAWCGGVVLGQTLVNWRDLDLNDITSIVYQTGEPDEKANTGAADPLGSLAWVFNHFNERGIGLSKGEHIITGSAVRTRFPVPGDSFTYEVAGASVQVNVL